VMRSRPQAGVERGDQHSSRARDMNAS
jgi:hypothetical protein